MGGSGANRITDAQADTLGGSFGAETHTLTVDEIPSHTHTTNATNNANGGSNTESGSGSKTHQAATNDATGGDDPHNNVQPTLFLNYIIKT